MVIISIVSLVLAVAALVYDVHVAVVYQTFNDGIKEWAESLDASIRDAINHSAREILRELDEKISLENQNKIEDNE